MCCRSIDLHIPIEEIEMGKNWARARLALSTRASGITRMLPSSRSRRATSVGGDNAIAEFEAEVSQMASTAYHENLVQLYGVTTLENGDMAAVVEFCAQGSLVDALYGAEGARLEHTRVVFGGAWRGVWRGASASPGRDSS
jgi:serine/threonine protein kinase